jgi:hypothetical protein
MMRVPEGSVAYEGLVKLKLAHARGFSLILPDLLIVNFNDWRWFQPHYFSPCLLSFFDEGAFGEFNIEPKPGWKLLIGVTDETFMRSYNDGSCLYRCRIVGPANLNTVATGTCHIDEDYRIWLNLFHHTSSEAVVAIRESNNFYGSRWNIQGNKRLLNVEYVYFTSLSRVRNWKHLQKIAMASNGIIHLIPTNGIAPRDVISINVYRESTLNRRHTIKLGIPADAIAPQHVWRHDANDQPVYYEVSHPAIFRIGLEPGSLLPIQEGAVQVVNTALKRFDYVVLGMATTKAGLIAPYDEEDTTELFKIERCGKESDIFKTWQRCANTDQYSSRNVEHQKFEK